MNPLTLPHHRHVLSHATLLMLTLGVLASLLTHTPAARAAGGSGKVEASASVSTEPEMVRGAPPTIKAPLPGHPTTFLTIEGGDVYAVMPEGTIRSIRTGRTVFAVERDDNDYSLVGMTCAAGAGPRFACLLRWSKTEGQGQNARTYQRLQIVDADGRESTLGSGSAEGYHIGALGIYIGKDGKLTYAWAETVPQGNQGSKTTQYLYTDGKAEEMDIPMGGLVSFLATIGGGDRRDPPVQFVEFRNLLWLVHRDGNELVVHPQGIEPYVIASSSQYDVRPVVTSDGWFYVLYHDPRDSTAHAAVTKDGRKWDDILLDGKESGWQLEAAVSGDRVYAVYYYFRNSFNKGLRVTSLRAGRRTSTTFTLVREHEFNTGWHPHFAIAADGTTYLTYLRHVENEERVWSKFDSPSQMREYEIKGGSGWEEDYKDYFLQTGVGAWLTWWNLGNAAPKAEDTNGLELGDTSYNVGRAVLVTGNIEARYGSINVGLSYAQGVVDDATEKLNDQTGVATGNVKIDELLPGHDIKLAGVYGRYKGTATIGNNVIGKPELALNTEYTDIQLLALNKWRIKYGLTYTQYRIPAAVHVYTAPANTAAYTYESSHFRDVGFRDIDLILGYSKLDYAAKYENYYNDIFLDASFAFGLSMLDFAAVPSSLGEKGSATSFNLRTEGRLGWLYFHRWESTGGFGIFVRPAYTAEFMMAGASAKPKDRESDKAKEDSIVATTSMIWLRHGPWLDLGAVW